MRWSSRAGRLPAEVRSALLLDRGDRLLAHAPTRSGSYAVATTAAFYIPDGTGGFKRLPWEQIEHAAWAEGLLRIREYGGSQAAEHIIGLADPRAVPETVQERVTATIVVTHYGQLPGGGGVRIIGRRSLAHTPPTVRGGVDLQWSFVFDPGLDPADPGLLAQAEQLLENLRRQTGL